MGKFGRSVARGFGRFGCTAHSKKGSLSCNERSTLKIKGLPFNKWCTVLTTLAIIYDIPFRFFKFKQNTLNL